MDRQSGQRQGSWRDGLSSTEEFEKKLAKVIVSGLNELADGFRAHFTPERVETLISSLAEVDGLGMPQVLGEEDNLVEINPEGENLENLMVHFSPKKFSLKTVLLLADQMITLVESYHKSGVVHQDIKPDNFLMGYGPDKNQVFLIDLGLSKRYLDKDNKHISFGTGESLIGTGSASFCSINANRGVELSRRDDLEALGHTLIFLLTGTLPWPNYKWASPKMHERLYLEKSALSPDDICKGLPFEFRMFISYSRDLRFAEEPDYNYVKMLFEHLFLRKGYMYDNYFDWTNKVDKCPESNQWV